MKKTHLVTIQIVLLATGAFAAVKLSFAMSEDGKLNPQPNVLHLKQSPFGRTLALAMRGPVDVYWHRGEIHDFAHGDGGHENCPDCASGAHHVHGPDCAHGADCEHGPHCEHEHATAHGPDCEHGPLCEHGDHCEHEHAHGEECEHDHHVHADEHSAHDLASEVQRLMDDDPAGRGSAADQAGSPNRGGLRQALLGRIGGMRKAYYSRTNNHADTRMHKAFVMGEIQKRLRLSYEMDPSNVAGYGAYFLFLSEAIARVEEENADPSVIKHRRQAALGLTHYTIAYCTKLPDEAPAMITGAMAAHDYLQIYLAQPDAEVAQARKVLQVLQKCLAQYESLRQQMIEDGRWEKYSVHRINEMEGAYSLVCKVLELDQDMYFRLKEASASANETPET